MRIVVGHLKRSERVAARVAVGMPRLASFSLRILDPIAVGATAEPLEAQVKHQRLRWLDRLVVVPAETLEVVARS